MRVYRILLVLGVVVLKQKQDKLQAVHLYMKHNLVRDLLLVELILIIRMDLILMLLVLLQPTKTMHT